MAGEVLSISQIREKLPYRYPMLLLDRVYVESETKFIGLKNISFNEMMFHGHFPGHPIFPGVLQVETMEQLAELAVADKINPNGDKDVYIKFIDKAKFRKPNNPGDRMQVEIEVLDITGDEAKVKGSIKNNSGVTCQCNLVLSVRDITYPQEMPELFTDVDKSEACAMDIVDIMDLIPHRYPFLLVDYVASLEGSHVTAVKNTTVNEPIFQGHKPGYAVMPGAIQAVIVAQAGCVYMLSREENKGKLAYFMSIERSEFLHPIFPGDQLICEVDLPDKVSRFGRGDGFIRVGDKIVSKTTMTFALIDR
jgi:3-hydroxyacyl-[acyl-carrier-protein] dehydratase